MTHVKGNLEMIEQLDMIGRTSEFARVFGIEFYHVLSRGSQVSCEALCDLCDRGNLEMIEQLDMIGRTSEFARVFGIEFYHVLSRGSQVSCEALCDSCEG